MASPPTLDLHFHWEQDIDTKSSVSRLTTACSWDIDHTALGAIVAAHHELRRTGGRVAIAATSAQRGE
jgi:hypothetical protein